MASNIQAAKEEIKNVIVSYLSKDKYDQYRIPFRMQRPIIMLGPPGIGKTAIVEQIAEEMGIGFVSYSITHHTRQSALGLPFIEHKRFNGVDYPISEYTMSEILASVYKCREAMDTDEGILFLDEVNCVSETLAPAMLQFLQYKTFGMHQLPRGWIIVTAGNPPEYNRAAREFDPAMLDRLLKIDIEPSYDVWESYAIAHGVHPAITSYLSIKSHHFYSVRAKAHGSTIVTPRGWEDLSKIMLAFEANGLEINDSLIESYLQNETIAVDFSAYYELFRKYEDDYKVTEIINGKADPAIITRANQASFDERIILIELLLDAILPHVRDVIDNENALAATRKVIVDEKKNLMNSSDAADRFAVKISSIEAARNKKNASDSGSAIQLHIMNDLLRHLKAKTSSEDAFMVIREAFNKHCEAHKEEALKTAKWIDNGFIFIREAFGEGAQESLIFISRLSADPSLIRFVSEYKPEEYMKGNKDLLFTERRLNLLKEIEELKSIE